MAEQFKVVWRREGCDRRSQTYETRRGADHKIAVLSGTFEEAFPNLDPDGYMCCGASFTDMCGCGGVTRRQEWDAKRAAVPPFTEPPSLLVREVGEWSPVEDGD